MALKKGVCKNFGNCTLADNQEIQEVDSSEFRCTECGKPLFEQDSKPPKHFPKWAKILIAVIALAGLVTGGFFLFKSCSNSKVRITVLSSDETMGIVRGGGTFGSGDTIKIEAEAKDGYRFMSWNDGNRERTREIVATNDITYTAQFSPEPPQTAPVVTITVESSDETMGTVRGGGTYDSMITISIEAIANKGYEFDSWNDGNIENPRAVITGRDETYVAKFKKKSGGGGTGTGTKQYSFGKYVGELKNGIPEGDGKFYYTRRVQIAKHDTDNPAHYAEAGDWFDGTWGNGDIVSGALYSKDGKIKEKIFAPKRFNPYDLNLDK